VDDVKPLQQLRRLLVFGRVPPSPLRVSVTGERTPVQRNGVSMRSERSAGYGIERFTGHAARRLAPKGAGPVRCGSPARLRTSPEEPTADNSSGSQDN
jgi:hypothetical protein